MNCQDYSRQGAPSIHVVLRFPCHRRSPLSRRFGERSWALTFVQAGVRCTKEHCDTLFRDPRRVRKMTRTDLTDQVSQAIGMPRKESDVVVCAIFDSIVRALRYWAKVDIRRF